MSDHPTTTRTTSTLEVPGAVLTYDVREPEHASDPTPLLMIGSPMGAEGFTTLAGHFADRRVVTYDPRGVERSVLVGDPEPATPATHADDLHRLVGHLGGPVDVFASSGGAANALAWVAAHPGEVRTLVAHEAPIPSVLPDADVMVAAMVRNAEVYDERGWGAAMAYFVALVSQVGPLSADWLEQEPPDPAAFGFPADDDGSRDDPMFSVNMRSLPTFPFDLEAVAAAPTRVVVGVGEESTGQMTARSAEAVAARLGLVPVVFPSGHGGFLGGEYGGETGKPVEFAAVLREVLAGAG